MASSTPNPPAASGSESGAAGVKTSMFVVDAPPTIYQTRLVEGRQDNATPQVLKAQLSESTFKALVANKTPLSQSIHGALRRFDGKELEVFDETSGSFLGLRIPQATFSYTLTKSGVLEIAVHRKELPVSVAHSMSPMMFVFVLADPANPDAVPEVLSTRPFMVASKEPKPRAPRPGPKRVRGPPPRRPFAAPASGREAEINALLAATATPAILSAGPTKSKGSGTGTGSNADDAGAGVGAGAGAGAGAGTGARGSNGSHGSSDNDLARPLKRGRAAPVANAAVPRHLPAPPAAAAVPVALPTVMPASVAPLTATPPVVGLVAATSVVPPMNSSPDRPLARTASATQLAPAPVSLPPPLSLLPLSNHNAPPTPPPLSPSVAHALDLPSPFAFGFDLTGESLIQEFAASDMDVGFPSTACGGNNSPLLAAFDDPTAVVVPIPLNLSR